MYDFSCLHGWRSVPPSTLVADAEGRVVLTLPDDFQTLLSLRLDGWARPVREVLLPDHWLHRLQGPEWGALRGNPERPLAFLTADSEGRRALELFSSTPGAQVEVAEFLYLSHCSERLVEA